jgi:aspartate carbamoyltransferase catalytic subunit
VPNLREYAETFGLDAVRVGRLPSRAVLMHPGPMNRGVEMMVDPSTLPNSLIHQQVSNGVSVRMAVLFDLLAGESSASHLSQVAS